MTLYFIGLPRELKNFINPIVAGSVKEGEPVRRLFWKSLRKYFYDIKVSRRPLVKGEMVMMFREVFTSGELVITDYDFAYGRTFLHFLRHGVPTKRNYVVCDKCSDDYEIIDVQCPSELVKAIETIVRLKESTPKDIYCVMVSDGSQQKSQFSIMYMPEWSRGSRHRPKYLQELTEIEKPLKLMDAVEICKTYRLYCEVFRLRDVIKYGLLTTLGYTLYIEFIDWIFPAIVDYVSHALRHDCLEAESQGIKVYSMYVDSIRASEPVKTVLMSKIESIDEDGVHILPTVFKSGQKVGLWGLCYDDVIEMDFRVRVWNYVNKHGQLPTPIESIMYPRAFNDVNVKKRQLVRKGWEIVINVAQRFGIRIEFKKDNKVTVIDRVRRWRRWEVENDENTNYINY